MEDIRLIEKLVQARGMSGFENEVLAVAREYCKDFARMEEDSMRILSLCWTRTRTRLVLWYRR